MRERENHITLSTPMSLYNMHILLIQILMCKLQLKKKKKIQNKNKTWVERFYGNTIDEYI